MKKLLFVCLLFPTLSAQAMDFDPLSANEIPQRKYIISFIETTEYCIPGSSVPQKSHRPYVDKEIQLQFSPYKDKATIIYSQKDEILPYLMESFYEPTNSCALQQKILDFETRFTLLVKSQLPEEKVSIVACKTQALLKEEIEKLAKNVQVDGIQKLMKKNREICLWIGEFLKDKLSHEDASLSDENFSNAVRLLSASYGGTGVINPKKKPDVYIKVRIRGMRLILPTKDKNEPDFLHQYRMIVPFKNFLKQSGFYIENEMVYVKSRN